MQLMNTVVEIFFCYILVYFFAFYNSDSLIVTKRGLVHSRIADKDTLQFMSRERPDVDNVPLPNFDYHTVARDMVSIISFTNRT